MVRPSVVFVGLLAAGLLAVVSTDLARPEEGQEAAIERSVGEMAARYALKKAALLFPPFRIASVIVQVLPKSVRDKLPIPKFLLPSDDGKQLAKALAKDALLKLYRLDKYTQTARGRYLMGQPAASSGRFYYDGSQWVPIVQTFYPVAAQGPRAYNYYYPVGGGPQGEGLFYNPMLNKFYRPPRGPDQPRSGQDGPQDAGKGKDKDDDNGNEREKEKEKNKDKEPESDKEPGKEKRSGSKEPKKTSGGHGNKKRNTPPAKKKRSTSSKKHK